MRLVLLFLLLSCPLFAQNTVIFNGVDTTTQGAWKGVGNFNAPPATASLVYGKDGDILPDTEGCDKSCNPFPAYVSFGASLINSATPGNIGVKPNATHAYVALVEGLPSNTGYEPANVTNTNFFWCNYTNSNATGTLWGLQVAWRAAVDTREYSKWYSCGQPYFTLEFSYDGVHNFSVYIADNQNGSNLLRSEELQMLDGVTNVILWDSGSFTNFTGGVYYSWTINGHVKLKIINMATNGRDALINGVFFDPPTNSIIVSSIAPPTGLGVTIQ
jgi:hypothetical protein